MVCIFGVEWITDKSVIHLQGWIAARKVGIECMDMKSMYFLGELEL